MLPESPARSRFEFAIVAVSFLTVLLVAWNLVDPGSGRTTLPLAEVARVSRSTATRAHSARLIRVRLTVDPVREAKLEIAGPYTLRPVGSDKVLARGAKLTVATVRPVAGGFRVGDREYTVSELEIIPEKSPVVRFAGHLYRGSLRIHRFPNDRLVLVNVLPLEEYLASVVDSEMPARFPDAAREAQAIIARTYALRQIREASPVAVYDVFATQRSQKYLGVEYEAGGRRLAGESAASRKIVESTSNLVCTSRGKLFTAYYAACCGGRTTTGTEIFDDACEALNSVACSGCRDAERYRWTVRIPGADFASAVAKSAPSQPRLKTIRTARQTAGPGDGKISRFVIGDGSRSAEVTGVQLRSQLPKLLSPHFSLKVQGAEVVAEGRGHGHGVGLCQWGARGMALQGKSALEILRHYYPGCRVAPIVD